MRRAIVLIAFLCALPLYAERFTVTFEGKPVKGADVCWFKAGDAGSPLTRFLASSEVTCRAASEDLALPEGEWNVFARKGNELVSDRVTSGTRELRVVRAVEVRADGEGWFVWIPRTASAMPFAGVVPADTDVVPLRVRHASVTATGEIVDGVVRTRKARDVVVPVTFAPQPPARMEAPLVELRDAKGTTHKPLRAIASGGPSLAIFQNVADGPATITIGGKRWRRVERRIEGNPDEPLVAAVTSKVLVHWWSTADLAQPAKASGCKRWGSRPKRESEAFGVELLRCPEQWQNVDDDWSPKKQCESVTSTSLSTKERRGTVELSDVPAGVHFLRVAHPALPALWKRVEVATNETTEVDFELRWFTFFGRVTKGTKPVHATLFGTVSDPETGEYTAVIVRQPQAITTNVEPCDGSWPYIFVPDELPKENARYDIEIPDNRIVVDVVDADTNAPIPTPHVTLGALDDSRENAAHFGGFGTKSDENGRAEFAPVLTKERLVVCAEKQTYIRKCVDPFRMGTTREKTIRLALSKAEERLGRVHVSGAIGGGMLMFYTREGIQLEWARLEPDGTFTLQKPHREGELVAFASASHPFYAFVLPRLEPGQPLDVRLPAAPVRNFGVTLATTSSVDKAFFGIAIGDLVVPLNAFSQHLMRTQAAHFLERGATAEVKNVLETAPIRAILVPFLFIETRGGLIDPLLLPEAYSLPRQALGEKRVVVFE